MLLLYVPRAGRKPWREEREEREDVTTRESGAERERMCV